MLTTPPATRLAPPSATVLEGSASPDSERSGTRTGTGSAAGWSTQTGSSILSSAEAYERSKGEQNISGPYTVQVRLMLRVLTGGLAVATALGLKRVALSIPNLKAKRQKYDVAAKIKLLDAANTHGPTYAISLAHNMTGYDHVCRRVLRRWRHELMNVKKKTGRRGTRDDFNYAVLEQLIFASVDKNDEQEPSKLRVEANVAFSTAIVQHAAKLVQATAAFQEDKKVQALKFTKPWVKTWSRNMRLIRRRVTTTIKKLPPPEAVREHMHNLHEHLVDFELDEIISADETGINYGVLPLNQLVPADAERAAAPDSDEKARITAMLWGTADGKMRPMFLILKCSAKGCDLTNTRVLQALSALAGFRPEDGWSSKVWIKTIPVMVNKERKNITYKIPYLIQSATCHVITLQHRAWMDTARLVMWFDLQLGPHYEAKRGYAGLVWDNCGPHGTVAVKECAEEWGISLLPLPPNMTDVLQVMDLVVNAPVKSALRRDRTHNLFNQFQAWKITRLRAQLEKKPLPPFQPPKPKVHDGVLSLLKMNEATFAQDNFQKAMRKCFIDVGIAPSEDSTETEVNFKEYNSHKHGSFNPSPHFKQFDSEHEFGSLGMAVQAMDGVLVETHAEAENADLCDDEQESDEPSDDEEYDDHVR